jgi:hypothetical protein
MFVMEADSLQAFVPDAWLNIGSVGYKYKNMPFASALVRFPFIIPISGRARNCIVPKIII